MKQYLQLVVRQGTESFTIVIVKLICLTILLFKHQWRVSIAIIVLIPDNDCDVVIKKDL